MPSQHTLKTIEDLKKAGLDVSSIETQLRNDPIVDKQVSGIIDNGILRLADYTRFAGEYAEKNKKLQEQITELASRQGAIGYLTEGSEAYKEMKEHIEGLEKYLVDADIFTEDSVKDLHALSQEKLQKLVSDSTNVQIQPPTKKEGEIDMPADFDPTKYIDTETHKTSMANLAMGTITMTAKINRQLDAARSLGVVITPDLESKLDENLMTGLSAGKNVEQIFNETFGLETIRATKAEESRQKDLKEAEDKGYARAKQEDGVPARRTTISNHAILNSKTIGKNVNTPARESYTGDNGEIDQTKLPKNERGEVELYKMRGNRTDRLARAAATHEKVMEIVANDPLYVP